MQYLHFSTLPSVYSAETACSGALHACLYMEEYTKVLTYREDREPLWSGIMFAFSRVPWKGELLLWFHSVPLQGHLASSLQPLLLKRRRSEYDIFSYNRCAGVLASTA